MSHRVLARLYTALSSTVIRLTVGLAILALYLMPLLLPAPRGYAESVEQSGGSSAALHELAKAESLDAVGRWEQNTFSNVLCVLLVLAMTAQSIAHGRSTITLFRTASKPVTDLTLRIDQLITSLESHNVPIRFASDEERQTKHGGPRR